MHLNLNMLIQIRGEILYIIQGKTGSGNETADILYISDGAALYDTLDHDVDRLL